MQSWLMRILENFAEEEDFVYVDRGHKIFFCSVFSAGPLDY